MPLTVVREIWTPVGREIVRIEWRKAAEQAVLVYDEGEPEHLVASEAMVTQLAEEIGLDVRAKSSESVLWERHEADSHP
jgi:hypothetical protein